MFEICTIYFLILLKAVLATERPIIGILAQELEPDDPYSKLNYTSYFAASYVKAVEASGARVVPIFIWRDLEYYKSMARKVNGFLYTGGASNIYSRHGVARSGKLILDEVSNLYKSGISIPILGVCQGMELLVTLSNGWQPILTDCQAEKEALTLKFLPGYRNSSLYQDATYEDIYTLSHLPSTSNQHQHCLTIKNLTRFNLTEWNVLSMSTSKNGDTFISSMEQFDLPIAAVQFHPEKLPFEWKPGQNNPHDVKSIQASRLFYDWLVTRARLNNNSFYSVEEEKNSLIYNYNPIFTGKIDRYDTQDYYFRDPPGILENVIDIRS